MDISFDKNVDTANTIEVDLDVGVVPPVAHFGHVFAARVILLVPCETVTPR